MSDLRVNLPAGPERSFFEWLSSVRDPVAWLDRLHARFGATFTVRLLRRPPAVYISDPELVKRVFVTDRDAFERTPTPFFRYFVGEGSLFLLLGDTHRQARKAIDPLFHGQGLGAFDSVVVRALDRLLDRLPSNAEIALYPLLEELMIDLNLQVFLGLTESATSARLRELLPQYLAAMTPPAWLTVAGTLRLPVPQRRRNRRIVAIKSEIYQLLRAEIVRCREEGGRSETLLRRLVDPHRDERSGAHSDDSICAQLLTFFIAGHSTTATSLAWTIAHLLAASASEQRLRHELRSAVSEPGKEPLGALDLPFLEAVIEESLRLHPIFLSVMRTTVRDLELGGYALPTGTTVAVCTHLLHRRADLWDEPAAFRPERFLGLKPSPFVYCPFGGGDRICVGNVFAPRTVKLVLARLLERAQLEQVRPGLPRAERWSALGAPEGGPVVRIRAVR
jgi:cytochrome P450